jgi:hypothetical protein
MNDSPHQVLSDPNEFRTHALAAGLSSTDAAQLARVAPYRRSAAASMSLADALELESRSALARLGIVPGASASGPQSLMTERRLIARHLSLVDLLPPLWKAWAVLPLRRRLGALVDTGEVALALALRGKSVDRIRLETAPLAPAERASVIDRLMQASPTPPLSPERAAEVLLLLRMSAPDIVSLSRCAVLGLSVFRLATRSLHQHLQDALMHTTPAALAGVLERVPRLGASIDWAQPALAIIETVMRSRQEVTP